MSELAYLLYLIIFVVGSILGLLFSYKKHSEAFIFNNIDISAVVIAIIGWVLLINYSLISSLLANLAIPIELIISIAVLCISFVIGMRPGYGRKETAIAILISVIIWLITILFKNLLI
ncbi:MAG: energy-converting hydrogenase subunit EhaL family protein [Methanobacteriaceae archaeon]